MRLAPRGNQLLRDTFSPEGRAKTVFKETLFVYSMEPYRNKRTASCSTMALSRKSSVITMAASHPASQPKAFRSIAVIGAE